MLSCSLKSYPSDWPCLTYVPIMLDHPAPCEIRRESPASPLHAYSWPLKNNAHGAGVRGLWKRAVTPDQTST